MPENRYAHLFEDDTLAITRRRTTSPSSSEFLTRDDRYTDGDGYPVRVTSGISWGTNPDGEFQVLQWDSGVSSPRGRINLTPGARRDDPLLSLRRTMEAVREGEANRPPTGPDLPRPKPTTSPASTVAVMIGHALWQTTDAGRQP